MKVLLPQPGGFEGLFAGCVLATSHNEAIPHGVDDRESHVDLGLASLHAPDDMEDSNDAIVTRVDQLLNLRAKPVQRAEPVLQ